ncbi:formate dehydrogenase N subunit beta transmembrane domain-containing protein [Shigella flexneri]
MREDLPNRRYPLRLQRGYENAGGRARGRAENPVTTTRAWTIQPGGRYARDVRAAPRRQAESVSRPAGEPGNQRHREVLEGIWEPLAAVGFAATFAASIFHYVGVGPNRAEEEDDNLHEEKDEVRK